MQKTKFTFFDFIKLTKIFNPCFLCFSWYKKLNYCFLRFFELAKFQFILFEVLILHVSESVPFTLFLQILQAARIDVQFVELGKNYNYLFFWCVFRLQKFLSMPFKVLKVSKIYSATQGRNFFQGFFAFPAIFRDWRIVWTWLCYRCKAIHLYNLLNTYQMLVGRMKKILEIF